MGYFDALYRPDNIIGHTGNIDDNPTVYFFTESRDVNGGLKTKRVERVDQILFLNGHITQHHNTEGNIGRELVMESYSYSMMNVSAEMQVACGFDPEQVHGPALQETFHSSETNQFFETPDGFRDFHVSRNEFQPVDSKDHASLMKLANAIARFPRLKPKYGERPDDDMVGL